MIKDAEFKKTIGVKQSLSKELTFHDFDHCVRNITNSLIATNK